MINSAKAYRGIVTSPHHLASQAGLEVLQKGGNAAEAAVAVAACLAVVYPHMTGIGGDSFWLHHSANTGVRAISSCGRAGANVTPELYENAGLSAVPWRGSLAANTVAGTIAGWKALLDDNPGSLSLADIIGPAIHHAENGVAVTAGGAKIAADKDAELKDVAGYAETFRPNGRPLAEGDRLVQPKLAQTLKRLVTEGLESYYSGALAEDIAADLKAVGSPITLDDLNNHSVDRTAPLERTLNGVKLHNTPPPTQGMSSLLILSLFEKLGLENPTEFELVHGLVEATKQAFATARKFDLGDPNEMKAAAKDILADENFIDTLASEIQMDRATDFQARTEAGDTTWFAVMDDQGNTVSAIQSTYFEFGSGIVLPTTGITWQNRGASFQLGQSSWNALKPGRKPFHTLNPALALFDDGRAMAYGTMGGEGQPQTQAALFTRYAKLKLGLQEAISAPRWLFGKTWGEESSSLKLENRFSSELAAKLSEAGHDVEILEDFTAVMGHAGALVRHESGMLEGATDPRSDGGVAAW